MDGSRMRAHSGTAPLPAHAPIRQHRYRKANPDRISGTGETKRRRWPVRYVRSFCCEISSIGLAPEAPVDLARWRSFEGRVARRTDEGILRDPGMWREGRRPGRRSVESDRIRAVRALTVGSGLPCGTYGRPSNTRLKGVSVARRNEEKPAALATLLSLLSPAWAPSPAPTS